MKTALLLSDSESTVGDDESDGYSGIENALSPQELANHYQRQFQAQQEANDKATATAAAEIVEELNVEEYVDDDERVAVIASHRHAGEDYGGGMDIMMDEDEDDDFVPAGGELLADDESVSIFQQHDNTPLGAIDLPYQHPNAATVVFGHPSAEDDEGSHLF